MARILILFVVIALSACSYDQQAGAQPEASAGVLSGRADVIDGDTLDVAGTRIRLFGIDAPEVSQTCGRGDGSAWSCSNGPEASLFVCLADGPSSANRATLIDTVGSSLSAMCRGAM